MKSCTCDNLGTECRELHSRAVAAGNPLSRRQAQADIVHKFRPLAYFVTHRRFSYADSSLKEDVVSAITVEWLSKLDDWKPQDPEFERFCDWCARLASNCAARIRRDEDRWPDGDISDFEPATTVDLPTQSCFHEKIESFAEEDRQILRWRMAAVSIDEIATRCQTSRYRVRLRLLYMAKELVKCMD